MSYTSYVASVDFSAIRMYRVNLLQEAMKANQIDAYLVSYPGNVRYVTDFMLCPETGTEGGMFAVVFQKGDPFLFLNPSDWHSFLGRIPWLPPSNVLPNRGSIMGIHTSPAAQHHNVEKIIKPLLDKNGSSRGRLAVDMMFYTFAEYMRKALPDLEIVDHEPLLKARAVKCEDEIKLFKLCQGILNTAADVAIEHLKPGARECEVAGAVAGYMHSQNIDFMTCIPQTNTGENVAPYMRTTTDRLIELGDPWYFDYNIQYMGLCSCISMFGNVGKIPEKQKALYRIVYDATVAMLEKLRPGVQTIEVYDAGARVFEKAGYEKDIPKIPGMPYYPGTKIPFIAKPGGPGPGGCSLGTIPHELPNLTPLEKDSMTVQKNMVFRITPQWFKQGVGGGRLKNIVVVRDGGLEILSKTLEYGSRLFDYP
jgi:Xaa-Pro aminopeptidase